MKQERVHHPEWSCNSSSSSSLCHWQGALEVSITRTHCPPGTQANVSPLDYSNICLMDVFWVEQATCTPDESLSCWVNLWGDGASAPGGPLYFHLPLLSPSTESYTSSKSILPSLPILQLFVCVCTCIHACSYVLVTGLHWEADYHPGAMPGFIQSTLLLSFGLMNG